MNLGTYHFPRPHRGYTPYPWIEADVGDFFVVPTDNPLRAMNSLRACAWAVRKVFDWQPEFRVQRRERGVFVERVA
jgi:hypothetical protein